MDHEEWCVVAHVDIGSRDGLDEIEALLRDVAAERPPGDGTIEVVALRVAGRPNHFEIVSRYRSEAGYHEHQLAPTSLAFRMAVAPLLGSPYEDRLHHRLGEQAWPRASAGAFVVITQVEIRPASLDGALPLMHDLIAARHAAAGLTGQVLLQRRFVPNNLELLSVWASPEAWDEHLASEAEQSVRGTLERLLLAPVDDRRYELIAGIWSGG